MLLVYNIIIKIMSNHSDDERDSLYEDFSASSYYDDK